MAIKINGTNTAANPSITGDDTDTGIVYGTNQIDFSTGGTSRANVDSSGNINIPNDSGKIQLGTSADLQIYHDGSHSYLKNSTGSLQFLDGPSEKFRISGTGTFFKDDIFIANDGDKINLGAGNDLQIYHNSNQNWIVSGSDNLYLKVADGNNDGKIRFLAADNSNMIECNNGDNVELYYNGSKKFETSGYGIKLHQLNTGAGNSDLRYNSSTGVVTYDTSSRLVKTDIEDSPYGIDIVKQLKPRKYKRTDQQDTPIEIGFVADEVQSLIPEVVPTGPKSIFTKNDSDTEIIPVNVDYRKLTVVLTTALQEAITKIETLETKVAALEAT